MFLGYTAADLAARIFLKNNLSAIEGITSSSTALEFWNSEHRDLLEKYKDEEDRGIAYRVADFMSLPYVVFERGEFECEVRARIQMPIVSLAHEVLE